MKKTSSFDIEMTCVRGGSCKNRERNWRMVDSCGNTAQHKIVGFRMVVIMKRPFSRGLNP